MGCNGDSLCLALGGLSRQAVTWPRPCPPWKWHPLARAAEENLWPGASCPSAQLAFPDQHPVNSAR